MNVIPTALKEVLIVEPDVYADKRGFFMETYHQDRYRKAGMPQVFVQDNLSFSVKGALRGLHYQISRPQAKLVQVVSGDIFDVAVDIRKGSPTFGQWAGVILSSETKRQLFVPEGFAHGFCVLSETALFLYKCSDLYAQGGEGGILWSDPAIGIEWPITDPIISDKDSRLPCLSALLPHQLPGR
jgi:dTDP-4-dehydrorhamnose 3,5-epimerase